MPKSFILHDESVNTYGFRMLTDGADLSEFIKNPVMLLNHNDWSLPIGRWDNIRKEDGKVLADPVYDLQDEHGKQVADKVKNDFIRAASIGAWPPEEVSDDPALKLPGQTGSTVIKWKAREASIVTIGSNHNALVFYDSKGVKIDMHDASSIIKLMDNYKQNPIQMNELNKILKLSDNADAAAQMLAVNLLLADKTRLEGDNARIKAENVTLTGKIDKINTDALSARKAKAVILTDAAVTDGRLNADGKDSFLELFDLDYEKAEKTLENLPKRKSVKADIDKDKIDNVELADFTKKSWDEIDRENNLTKLHDKYPDLYKEKFEKRFPSPKQ